MATVPTNKMERELRALYLRWLARLPSISEAQIPGYINKFERESRALIAKLGGQTASLGALAGFPVPKTLALSPQANVIYDSMKQAAIKSSIAAGLQATDAARQILNAGMQGSFSELNRLARTETVSAYWKNGWDSVRELDELVMLWGSEFSDKTCDYCIERDGLVVEDESIRDHPNGRCTLVPTFRERVDYKGTLLSDGSIFMDPEWTGKRAKVEAAPKGDNLSNLSEYDS